MAMRARAERDQAHARLERSTSQLRALTLKVAAAEEQERRRLAHVLHDHVQQLLAGARYGLESTRESNDGQLVRATLARVDGMLGECMEVSRSLTMELSPPVLYDAGLGPALEWLGLWYREKHGLTVIVTLDERVIIEEANMRIVLFQAVRELLFNVVKHAGVKTAQVLSTMGDDGRARIVVSDTGVGCDPERAAGGIGPSSGLGLFGIRERLDALGGSLEIEGAPGCGSRFTLVVPSARTMDRFGSES
jgi:signal transduction histidine kinase